MKNWFSHYPACPAFMRRLWCQLAVTYTLLAICAFAVLIMIMYGLNDFKDFYKTRTPGHIHMRVTKETLLVTQALREQNRTEWQKKTLDNIRETLLNLEEADKKTDKYRITNSSRPALYMRIMDATGHPLITDPARFPAEIASVFASQEPLRESRAYWVAGNGGPIWMDMPVSDDNGAFMGRLQLLYIAEFDWRTQLGSILNFLFVAFDWVIVCSVPIGIACGLVAARYVTHQLQKMNEVTESWRQGNFSARIELPNDDVLIRHSQHLNDMAQDLEMYLNLKQSLAVSDERTRLARELHDTVKQKLFALGLQLATAKSKPAVMDAAGEHISEAETITHEAQHDLMEIITQLRPAGTGKTSLHERIGLIADDFKRRFGVDIGIPHMASSARSSAHTEHHVLRIVQEALMNAVRHGKASHIMVASAIEHEQVSLTITDNGHGFDTGQRTGGFGITSMRDRARDLPQGTLDIQSIAGRGTTIILSWKNAS